MGERPGVSCDAMWWGRRGRWDGESRVFERAERGSGHGRGPPLWWGNKGTSMNVQRHEVGGGDDKGAEEWEGRARHDTDGVLRYATMLRDCYAI